MPRVRRPRPTVAAPAAPSLPDRPGRLKLLLRRRRNLMKPLALLALLGMLGIALAGTVQGLGSGTNWSDKFASAGARLGLVVADIRVDGQVKTPKPLLDAAIGARRGDPILGLSLPEMKRRIETINWVQSAAVERRLPGQILVRIVERSPYAVWQNKGEFKLIDKAGGIVADGDVMAFAGQLPLVVGLGAPAAAAALIEALAKEKTIQPRVAAAVRIGERRWNLRLTNGTDVLLPEAAESVALAKLAELHATQQLLDRQIAVIDMRLPDRLVLRPASEKSANEKPTPDKQANSQAKKT